MLYTGGIASRRRVTKDCFNMHRTFRGSTKQRIGTSKDNIEKTIKPNYKMNNTSMTIAGKTPNSQQNLIKMLSQDYEVKEKTVIEYQYRREKGNKTEINETK